MSGASRVLTGVGHVAAHLARPEQTNLLPVALEDDQGWRLAAVGVHRLRAVRHERLLIAGRCTSRTAGIWPPNLVGSSAVDLHGMDGADCECGDATPIVVPTPPHVTGSGDAVISTSRDGPADARS
jgi:hypothetical protein